MSLGKGSEGKSTVDLENALEEMRARVTSLERMLAQAKSSSNQIDELNVMSQLWDAVVVTDFDGNIADWNPAAELMFGFTKADVIGQAAGMILPTEENQAVIAHMLQEMMQHKRWRGELHFVRKDGSHGICESVVVPVRDAQGNVVANIGVHRDNSWREKAQAAISQSDQLRERVTQGEHELHVSEQRYRDLIHCLPDIVWNIDLSGVLSYVSPIVETITGYKPDHFIGVKFSDPADKRLPGIYDDAVQTKFEDLLRKPTRDKYIVYEQSYLRADGSSFDAEIRATARLDEHGKLMGVSGITRDISALKAAQQEHLELAAQLQQVQKMDAFGQLAGGIAHDFNNLLTAVIGHTELLLDGAAANDPEQHSLTEIKNASERGARLTRNLLAFSRKQILQPRVIDIGEILANMEDFLRDLFGEIIEITIHQDAGTHCVNADPGQVEQVIMNLLVNARDALPRGGLVTISIENIRSDGRSDLGMSKGAYVRLSVVDSGTGISPEILPRVFEPFYTTKDDGNSIGFGLATVYGIVHQSGGAIEVLSDAAQGSTFHVYLPQATENRTVEEPAAPYGNQKNSEMIMVAEDNAVVGSLLKHSLEKVGYQVLYAENGERALGIAEQHPGNIDLLVTDVVMPQMGGLELAAQLVGIRPTIAVLFISGHSDELVDNFATPDRELNFLQKPFSQEEILQRVRLILASKSARKPAGKIVDRQAN